MKLFTITFNKSESLYLQLYKQIKKDILENTLEPNEKLPSKRKLASHLNISVNTVLQAYNLLIDEGFVITIEKKGYFVLDYNVNIKNNKFEKSTTDIKIKNKPLYDLTTKNVDYKSFPIYTWGKISKNIINTNSDILHKTPGNGYEPLRLTIKKYLYETKGLVVNHNNIIIGSGIEYLLTLITSLIKNENYAIENPGYDKLNTILLNNNKQVSYIELDNEGIDIELITKTNCKTVYVTPANQFPTGIKMSLNRKLKLIEWANKIDGYIIEDDFDSEFKYFSKASSSLLSLSNNKVIFISTYSRTIAPSLRIAYTILPDELLLKYNEKYKNYSSTVSTIDQLILDEFITSGHYSRHLNKTKNLYKKKRDLILSILSLENELLEIDDSNGYLSLNVKLLKKIDVPKFKNLLFTNNMDIFFIDHFYFTSCSLPILIIGYSSIDINLISKAINTLIFTIKQCII